MRKCPGAVSVFIKAPSFKELVRRLKKRGTETAGNIKKRLDRVRKETEEAKHYDLVVVNKTLPQACRQVEQFLIEALETKRF